MQIDTAKSILSDYEEIADLDCITDYFSRLYHHRGETLDKKNINNSLSVVLLKEIGDSYVYQTNQEFLLKKERV